MTSEVEVENSGASVVNTYEVVVDPSAVKRLSYVSISEHGNELPVRKTSDGYVSNISFKFLQFYFILSKVLLCTNLVSIY